MSKKYSLGVLSYFKNERHILFEWISHYKKWGIEHIWLIDNGSEDNYDVEIFIKEGFITIFKEPVLGQQESYNKYLPKIKQQVKWLGVFDMDEFLYSKENSNIKEILNSVNNNTELISIQMTIFYPCSFESPTSIIETNIIRKCYDSIKHPKCIFNLDLLNKVSIHGFKVNKCINISAEQHKLCINHYRYGSFEYLYGIKEGRGGGVHKNKYKNYGYGKKFMTLLNSEDIKLTNDSFLRDNSLDLIELCKTKKICPLVELYPQSSWLYLKNNYNNIYHKYKNIEILNLEQIDEINTLLNNIVEKQYCIASKKNN